MRTGQPVRSAGIQAPGNRNGAAEACRQNRADAVRDYCLESSENGLDADQKALLKEKAVTRGFAGTDLVYDENGKEDRDASRRVLVKFFITVK